MMSAFAVLLVAATTVVAADAVEQVKLDDVQCVIASRDAQESKSADYKEGKVYFCCGGCAGKFAKTPEKFSVQANRQLVQTKQYEQKGCPFSGGEVNPETTLTVAGAKVAFCCNGCKGKVEGTEKDKQAELVFNDKAFSKGFEKKAKKSDS
ncbi:hypothetical protein [Rhodopirellula halodulae]|nr:hypothetical protein [Rhodopirellula sp. JC737]